MCREPISGTLMQTNFEVNFSLQLGKSDKFLWAVGADMLARQVGARGMAAYRAGGEWCSGLFLRTGGNYRRENGESHLETA